MRSHSLAAVAASPTAMAAAMAATPSRSRSIAPGTSAKKLPG